MRPPASDSAPAPLREVDGPHGPPARVVGFAEAFRFWLKLGFISFGGPAGQIAIMHSELVERRRWISEERFLHALNYCMLLPGPEAQQLATYVGWLLHRVRGGLVAGGLFVLPSVFVLFGLSWTYAAHGETAAIAGVLAGFRPVVVAIVCEAVLRIGRRAVQRWAHLAIAATAFVAIYWLHMPFPWIVGLAALAGWLGSQVAPRAFLPRPRPAETVAGDAAAVGRSGQGAKLSLVIDDDSPLPPHTRPSWARLLRTVAVGALLWLAAGLGLAAWRGAGSLQVQQYTFFTQAAFVTFGGAYAVLAYVAQAAVGTLGWLTHAQTVDGLALAETTPGPLVMVVQFVGFMAGWNHPGDLSPLASGALGAAVTTFVTFLPCFLFIFVGAPYIEVLRTHRGLAAALSGVTAAVVGVILNLAVTFGSAVLFPAGRFDTAAALLAVVAFVVLQRWRVNVLWVVLGGGLLGLGRGVLLG
jgi:chromate transporter